MLTTTSSFSLDVCPRYLTQPCFSPEDSFSLDVCPSAMYLASVEERAIVFCTLDVHKMSPPVSFRKNPVWECHPVRLLAQSESACSEPVTSCSIIGQAILLSTVRAISPPAHND